MLGVCHGFTVQVKQENSSVMMVHSLVHHKNFASRKLSHELKKVMQEVIQVVNFIKAKALNSWLFAKMSSDFESEHILLLYHSEIRWLLQRKVLNRLLELKIKTEAEKSHLLAHKFANSKWLMQVAYLADVY